MRMISNTSTGCLLLCAFADTDYPALLLNMSPNLPSSSFKIPARLQRCMRERSVLSLPSLTWSQPGEPTLVQSWRQREERAQGLQCLPACLGSGEVTTFCLAFGEPGQQHSLKSQMALPCPALPPVWALGQRLLKRSRCPHSKGIRKTRPCASVMPCLARLVCRGSSEWEGELG